MTDFLTLNDISCRGKTVLVRADLNVPMHDGVVTDRSRLENLLPTLNELAKVEAKIVILSHFGRPEGTANLKYSLRPVAKELSNLWGQPVAFAEDCVGPQAQEAIKALPPGQVLVLENTRFHPGEEKNNPELAKAFATLGDIYINDAFSCAHRAHASTEGLAHLLPAAAGRLMQAEVEALIKALTAPARPVAAIVGGSKISTKLDLLNNLVSKVDILVLGGGMANTFVAANGVAIGKSLSEPDMYETAKSIMAEATRRNCKILLPKDVVTAAALKEGQATQIVSIDAVPVDQMILDLGPDSVQYITENISGCKTVVWNGPLGAFEIKPFNYATNAIAKAVANLTKTGKILSVAGGGDTVAALTGADVTRDLSYLSMAGGAFLEWLEGKKLPGIVALEQAASQRTKVAV